MYRILVFLFLLFAESINAQEKVTYALIETNMGNMKVKLYNNTPRHRDNFIALAQQGVYDGTLFYRCVKNFVIQGGSSDSKNAIRGQHIGFGKGKIIESEILDENYHKKGALAAPRQPDRENYFKESDIAQFYIVQGRVYPQQEIDYIVKKVNVPIKNAINQKVLTPERKEQLRKLKEEKKYDEFRALAQKIKDEIAFEWDTNTNKLFMSDQKAKDYTTIGGLDHLDGEYTVFGEVVEGLDVIDKIAALPTDSNDRPLTDVKIKVKILP